MPVSRAIWEEIGYEPFEEQLNFHRSDARFKIPACGRRFGKSRMAAVEVAPYLFDVNKPGRGWIVAPSYDTADEFNYLYEDIILGMKMGGKLNSANNPRTGEMYIETPWRTRVDVKSAAHPKTLVGKGLRWVILSEAAKLPENIFKKYIRPALADYRAPCIMPSTPEGFNWYYKEYKKGQDRKRFPEYESWNFPAWKNRNIYPLGFKDSEIQNQDPSEDNAEFWQEIGADFRSVVGLVYRQWTNDNIRRWPYDPRLSNYLAFDFGYSNPFVCLDIQVTPSEDVYVWREYYKPGLPVHLHVEELKRRENPTGYKIEHAYGDSADAGAVDTIGRSLCKITAKDEAKDKARGLKEVRKFIRNEYDVPRLFVDPSCVNTIAEFESHKMKEPSPASKSDPKDEPESKNNHCLDAIRYFIMHHFFLGGKTGLSDLADLYQSEDAKGIFTWGDEPVITMGASPW